MKPEVQPNKIAIFSGAGVSAESGLPTFRDSDGLWNNYSWRDVATPEAWLRQPELVLDFYNQRRKDAWQALPNAAHLAIASLEAMYEVVVITQNVDELHERAGSSNVIHLHGRLSHVRGTAESSVPYRIDDAPVTMGQLCEAGTQLRPDIVWFGEAVQHMEEARHHVASAARVLVIGTSLAVYPAASLVKRARGRAEKLLVAFEVEKMPYGFQFIRGKASKTVPNIVARWLGQPQSMDDPAGEV